MNRISTIAAIALSFAAAGSAYADDITIDTAQHLSTQSRAAVQAELASFKQQRGNQWTNNYDLRTSVKSERTRADVLAELNAARASGELAAIGSEDSGSTYLAQGRNMARNALIVAGK